MKGELKCVMCVAEAEAVEAGAIPKEVVKGSKIANAYVVYQGSTMCKRHMFGMVRAQMEKQASRIAVPQV